MYIFPSAVFSLVLTIKSFEVISLKVAALPSLNSASIATTLSRVTPYLIEVLPEELFPTIPPIMHLLEVEVFGPKNKPNGFKYTFKESRTIPGCNFIVFADSSKARIFVKCLETSTTMPSPTHWPAKEVPAVLGINVILFFVAKSIKIFMSFSSFGYATANGIFLYTEASVAYKVLCKLSKSTTPESDALSFFKTVF